MKINWNKRGFRQRFREVISELTDSYPCELMTDDWLDLRSHDLQEWCVNNANCFWLTGEGIIDAATLLVERAYESGNIDDEGRVV